MKSARAGMIAVFGAMAFTQAMAAEPAKTVEGPFKPTWESLKQYKCPDWFRDAKLGIWAHWGPQCVPEQGDWYARHMYEENHRHYQYHVEKYGHPSKFGYKDIIPLFKAEKWDPDQLMALYKKAGAKYFVSMGCHHDNFDMWNSQYHRWNAVNMGPKRDIVGDWKKAAYKLGLKFGVSEHLGASWAWFGTAKDADAKGPLKGVPYDGADPKFADLYYTGNAGIKRSKTNWYAAQTPESFKQEWFNRITDLIQNYQPDLLYSDGSLPFGDYGKRMLALYYNYNLQQHAGKIEAVYTCKFKEDGGEYVEGAAIQDVERGVLEGIRPEPWQTDTSVADWFHNRDYQYKTPATVIQMLADIVSKNGNLLINFPQKSDGTLTDESLSILNEMAEWMDVNAEAIFGTRPWKIYGEGPSQEVKGGHFNEKNQKYTAADIRFTTKGSTLYAITLGCPKDKFSIRALADGNTNFGKISNIYMLGVKEPVRWVRDANGLEITLPDTMPCKHACAFRIIAER